MNPNRHGDGYGSFLQVFAAVVFAALAWLASPASATNRMFLATTAGSGPITELSVVQAESVALYLRMNFDDTTVGGGVSLRYDKALLRLDAVTFDAVLDDDESLRCPVAATGSAPACPVDADFLSFGNLLGLGGDRSVARLDLTALGTGTSAVGVDGGLPFSDVRGAALPVVMVPEPSVTSQLVSGTAILVVLVARRRKRAPGFGPIRSHRVT